LLSEYRVTWTAALGLRRKCLQMEGRNIRNVHDARCLSARGGNTAHEPSDQDTCRQHGHEYGANEQELGSRRPLQLMVLGGWVIN
jgi:hypothetical protein